MQAAATTAGRRLRPEPPWIHPQSTDRGLDPSSMEKSQGNESVGGGAVRSEEKRKKMKGDGASGISRTATAPLPPSNLYASNKLEKKKKKLFYFLDLLTANGQTGEKLKFNYFVLILKFRIILSKLNRIN